MTDHVMGPPRKRKLSLGHRIVEARKRLGITQGELAGKIEVTPGAISQFEKDTAAPSLETAVVLAKKLGVSTDWLLGIESEDLDSAQADFKRTSALRLMKDLAKALDDGRLQQTDIDLLGALLGRLAARIY